MYRQFHFFISQKEDRNVSAGREKRGEKPYIVGEYT